MNAYWLIAAKDNLRAAAHREMLDDPRAFDVLVERINRTLGQVFPGQIVLVRDRLSGYRPFDGLVILLVEVQPNAAAASIAPSPFPSPGVYIVKVAFDERRQDLAAELKAWDEARPPHMRSDNIFVSLDPFPPREVGDLDEPPIALVYGDAGTVLGSRNVLSLEEAIFHACRYGQPKPQSIVRLLESLYERLETHFFKGFTTHGPDKYLADDARPRLTDVLVRWREPVAPGRFDPLAGAPPVERDADDVSRQRLRRETLALLAGDHESYADPVDYLSGVWEQRAAAAGVAPLLHRGFAHGDLHARNINVAVVKDEAAHCALYDYEKMRRDNFIAWDFIKMEVELAVRLLDVEAAQEWPAFIRQTLIFWRFVAARTDEVVRHQGSAAGGDPEAIDLRLSLPRDPQLAAEAAELPPALRRLAVLLVALRWIARRFLHGGFEWLSEYDFLLAWYATRAGLYPNYIEHPKMIAAALIAAGVSARRMMRRQPSAPMATRQPGEMSHRPRYIHARRLARSGVPDERDEGVRLLEDLKQDYPHVLEIEEELALGYLEQGAYPAAEALLHGIEPRYSHTTAESPARLGALWKRRAAAAGALDVLALRKALAWYRRAEAIQGDYFPAINVASVLFMLGDRNLARAKAEAVLQLLAHIADPSADPFWPHATHGEALLLIGDDDPKVARGYYERAVAERDCTPRDRRTMRLQLELLRPFFDHATAAALSDAELDRLFPKA